MVGWHDAEEEEGSEHLCYRLKVNPENYHENGHDTLEFETKARLEVELYYAFRDTKTPEERNEYRRIYTQWHPQSYQFRNLRIMIEDDDFDSDCLPNLVTYQEDIEIREEEYEEDDNEITATDQLGSRTQAARRHPPPWPTTTTSIKQQPSNKQQTRTSSTAAHASGTSPPDSLKWTRNLFACCRLKEKQAACLFVLFLKTKKGG